MGAACSSLGLTKVLYATSLVLLGAAFYHAPIKVACKEVGISLDTLFSATYFPSIFSFTDLLV